MVNVIASDEVAANLREQVEAMVNYGHTNRARCTVGDGDATWEYTIDRWQEIQSITIGKEIAPLTDTYRYTLSYRYSRQGGGATGTILDSVYLPELLTYLTPRPGYTPEPKPEPPANYGGW